MHRWLVLTGPFFEREEKNKDLVKATTGARARVIPKAAKAMTGARARVIPKPANAPTKDDHKQQKKREKRGF
jgi:hypothetical protein